MERYEAIGTGIEEMTTAQNYETNSVRDVLGQTRTTAVKGNKTVEVNPLTINPASEFAKFVDTAIERQWELTDLEKEFLFVKMYKLVNDKPVAWRQKGIVVPSDWAIGNADLQASVEVNLVGAATYGTIDFDATGNKFTPETAPPAPGDIEYVEGDAARSDFVMYYIYDPDKTTLPG